MIGLTIASAALLIGFVILSVHRFGLLSCYSAYAKKWDEALDIHNVNLWSAVTVVSALLLIPPLIEHGADNPLQFLGFVAPLYLLVVAFTPRYESVHKDRIIHTLGAAICAFLALCWIVFVRGLWWIAPTTLAVMLTMASVTRTVKSSWLFWLEMTVFAAAWAAIFIC